MVFYKRCFVTFTLLSVIWSAVLVATTTTSDNDEDDINLETVVNDTVVAGTVLRDGGTVSGGKCVPLSWKCDGEFDCEDEADEPPTCREELKKCSAQQFRCDDRCIPLMWKCDGEFDCADETDEPSTCGDESSGDQDEYDDDYFVEDDDYECVDETREDDGDAVRYADDDDDAEGVLAEKAFDEKVEKLTSMVGEFNDKFVKPFNAEGVNAVDVLKNLAKNPTNFVAISSLIGSVLTFVALSPDSLPLTVGKFNETMTTLHLAIGDLQRHLDRRLDQLERLMVNLSVESEIFTPIKSMMDKITLSASNPRIHLEQLEASCHASLGWMHSDLLNKLDSFIEYIPVLSKRGASTRAGLEEVTEYFLAMLMELQFLKGVCDGIMYKRAGVSANGIQLDAVHHGSKMAAIERKITAQDDKIMASYFPDAAYEIAREIMKNGGSNEDMANKISQKLSKDYSPNVFIVGVYDATQGWENHGISEHYAQSTLFKLDHQVDGGLFGKHLLIHRASGVWGFKPKCDFGGVVDKLTDTIQVKAEHAPVGSASRGRRSEPMRPVTTSTKDLRKAIDYVREKCKDSVSFVSFVRFGNGLRVRGSMPDDGWQFEDVESAHNYSMVIGLRQSDQPVQWISTKSSQTSADVQIDIDTLINDIHAAFIESIFPGDDDVEYVCEDDCEYDDDDDDDGGDDDDDDYD